MRCRVTRLSPLQHHYQGQCLLSFVILVYLRFVACLDQQYWTSTYRYEHALLWVNQCLWIKECGKPENSWIPPPTDPVTNIFWARFPRWEGKFIPWAWLTFIIYGEVSSKKVLTEREGTHWLIYCHREFMIKVSHLGRRQRTLRHDKQRCLNTFPMWWRVSWTGCT